MAVNNTLVDETGAATLTAFDTSQQVDFGGSTPVAPMSMDGVAVRKATTGYLGDARAVPGSAAKSSGSVNIAASTSVSITHSLGRLPLVIKDQMVNSNGIYLEAMTTTTFTLLNSDNVNARNGVAYAYI